MGTNYIAPIWRMPENTNKDKLSNYSINFDGSTRTHIGIGEVKGGPFLPGGQTYTSNVTVQNPKFSGSAFINFDTSLAYPVGNIVGVGQVGGASFWFLRKNANNNIEFLVRTDAGSPYYATITGSTVLNANQWYHAAFSWDGNTITLYLNGSVDGSGSATTFYNSSFTNSGYASIGSYWRGGININTLWVGELSQVSIFDYALDSTQINYLYNLNNPMVISGGEPIAYYPLGDNSNPNADAGYPNISVGADSVFDFNGYASGNAITLDNTIGNGFTQITCSIWVKLSTAELSNTSTYRNFLVKFTNVPGPGPFELRGNYSRGDSYNNKLFFRVNTDTGSYGFTDAGFALSEANRWYHIVGTYDGSNVKTFVDGIERSSISANGTLISNSNDATIGFHNGTGGFDGEMSNAQIWNIALSEPEIETLYNNGQPLMTGTQPQATNLKAWYKLNQYDSYWDLGGNGKWTFNNAAIN